VLSVDDGVARIRASYANVAVDTSETAGPEVATPASTSASR
jgi:hypothetical protein